MFNLFKLGLLMEKGRVKFCVLSTGPKCCQTKQNGLFYITHTIAGDFLNITVVFRQFNL